MGGFYPPLGPPSVKPADQLALGLLGSPGGTVRGVLEPGRGRKGELFFFFFCGYTYHHHHESCDLIRMCVSTNPLLLDIRRLFRES